ncbi:MAG: hypothetical protein CME65_08780 [Halobacteriovoraceae bacterium]|nr:hypothetical protein [Halobacteriovoraceae bacterium]|tara:strand:+ start:1762 stop:2232 length:471 start_codon:yes stop_codon:yes gene_type:complete
MIIDHLSKQSTKDEIVETIKSYLNSYTKTFQLSMVDLAHPSVEFESHCKYILECFNTELGELVLELIIFKAGKSTGAHTHPAFMADKILKGELEETLYICDSNGYKKNDTILRKEGEGRTIFCPNCFPHDVKAINGNCVSLSLTLGEEKVEKINVN